MDNEGPIVQDLLDLGRVLGFPETPDLVNAFRVRLAAHRRHVRRLRAGLIAAIALGVALTAEGVSAGWFEIPHFGVSVVASPPAVSPSVGEIERNLLETGARAVTLNEARLITHGLPILPAALPSPDAVYVVPVKGFDVVYVVYRPSPGLPPTADPSVGLLLVEIPTSDASDIVFEKAIGPGTTVQAVRVNGAEGYWIHGAQHFIAPAAEPSGLRVSSDALIWRTADNVFRIEVAVSESAALVIAQSMCSPAGPSGTGAASPCGGGGS